MGVFNKFNYMFFEKKYETANRQMFMFRMGIFIGCMVAFIVGAIFMSFIYPLFSDHLISILSGVKN